MNYNINLTPKFKRQLKKLLKKYNSLKNEIDKFEIMLSENPFGGVEIIKNTYKIRLKIKSKGKGKSAGARIIYFIVIDDKDIYLLSIYDKSEKANISEKKIKELIKQYKL